LANNAHPPTRTVGGALMTGAIGLVWEYANCPINAKQKQVAATYATLLVFIYSPLGFVTVSI
jgi:ABC-type siderophore export system fused ATPase/permease subunit